MRLGIVASIYRVTITHIMHKPIVYYDILSLPATMAFYSDADYANDHVDRRSISGYVTMIDGNVLSYASPKQEINALSTCEVEYVAMSEATKDLLWLAGLCGGAGSAKSAKMLDPACHCAQDTDYRRGYSY
ncbi:Copia type Polyprotein [Phytophthora megakarya]|uniref:Copia type Polyprotein n=1 Tax=Phytophthora megakarya TaxID=4795 RepID=A0A225UFA4_9STRA|nr:Copia type Polyprotein [Phytophthora megakarya]